MIGFNSSINSYCMGALEEDLWDGFWGARWREKRIVKGCSEGEVSLHCRPSVQFSSVQLLGHIRLFATPWIAARQASLSITNSRSSLKHTSIESLMPRSHLILCHPHLLLPTNPPSIRLFYNESTLHMRWPKYWSFSFSMSPSKEIPGLISFKMDWLDLLAVQGTLKSLLQHHSSKASILWRSAFFTIPLSHPSSRWCHPAISSSVVPFFSCPQSLPTSESFPMSQFFAWGGQSTGVSALASFLPKNTQDWSPLKGDSLLM